MKYQIGKFGFNTKEVGADARYDEPEIHAAAYDRNIKTYIPRKDRGVKEDDGTYTRDDFQYDSLQDVYICPNGCVLKFSTFKKGRGIKRYASKTSDCKNCPFKSKCLSDKKKTRYIERSYHWTQYEKQHENDTTERYMEVQRLRKIWCEGTFSHQKARHCMIRAKMRGIAQTTGQCLLSACAVNLKRMIKWINESPSKPLNSFFHSLSAHLWALFMSFVNSSEYVKPFDDVENDGNAIVVGIISNILKKTDRNGKKYAYIQLYSAFGIIEVICWNSQYSKYTDLIVKGGKVAIKCKKKDNKAFAAVIKSYDQWLKDTAGLREVV